MGYVAAVILALFVIAAIGLIARRLRRERRVAARKDAIAGFAGHLPALEQPFLAAASATGKPRGLRWVQCRLQGEPSFAEDRVTGELYALIAATISFEAIEGGGMEDVEAVSNLRAATAVFAHRGGVWTTDGRVVFNLDPSEALRHYQESLAPVSAE